MQLRLETDLAPTGLTRLGALVLSGIGDEGLATPSALATYAGITRPALSRLLRGLEDRGLIARAPVNEGDARRTTVELTAEGVAMLALVRAAFDALHTHFAAKLPADALRQVTDALDTLTEGEPAPTAY